MTIAKYYIPSGRCIQALDYTHRNPDGSVGKIPDSLKIVFTTKNGRKVFDGGGIDPEVLIYKKNKSALLKQLIKEGYIFKYAGEYSISHEEISPANKFTLSDEDYAKFISWLAYQNFSFNNPLSEEIEQLKKETENSIAIKEDVKKHLQNIENRLDIPLNECLLNNREEIKRQLEISIATQYYLEPGLVEASLSDDPAIAKAIELLSSNEEYRKLLSPTHN
jgi:carboxyl-terminal processing protease